MPVSQHRRIATHLKFSRARASRPGALFLLDLRPPSAVLFAQLRSAGSSDLVASSIRFTSRIGRNDVRTLHRSLIILRRDAHAEKNLSRDGDRDGRSLYVLRGV